MKKKNGLRFYYRNKSLAHSLFTIRTFAFYFRISPVKTDPMESSVDHPGWMWRINGDFIDLSL